MNTPRQFAKIFFNCELGWIVKIGNIETTFASLQEAAAVADKHNT